MIHRQVISAPVQEINRLQAQAQEQGQEILLLARMPWVVTLGFGSPEHETFEYQSLPVERVDRGGGETVHYPGQVTACVVVNYQARGIDPREWQPMLLSAAQATCAAAGVVGEIDPERLGVFAADGRKLVSLGVRKLQGWTRWGIGLNVLGDVTPSHQVTLCQEPGLRLTTLQEQGSDWDWDQVAQDLGDRLLRQIDLASVTSQYQPNLQYRIAA